MVYTENIVETGPTDDEVYAITGWSGVIKGEMSGTPVSMRLPSSGYQELWRVDLEDLISKSSHAKHCNSSNAYLEPGDCGAWVVNWKGDLFGHIVAGHPRSRTAYIVPAYAIRDQIQHVTGKMFKFPNTKATHVFSRTNELWSLDSLRILSQAEDVSSINTYDDLEFDFDSDDSQSSRASSIAEEPEMGSKVDTLEGETPFAHQEQLITDGLAAVQSVDSSPDLKGESQAQSASQAYIDSASSITRTPLEIPSGTSSTEKDPIDERETAHMSRNQSLNSHIRGDENFIAKKYLSKLGSSFALPAHRSWPQPELSCGAKLIGLGRMMAWSPVGPAQELANELLPSVKHLLVENVELLCKNVPVPDALFFEIFMIGRDQSHAKPTLLVHSQSKAMRQQAIKLIKQSQILDPYLGVLLAESSRPPIEKDPPIAL